MNNKGVSVVVGVILTVAITVAIACTFIFILTVVLERQDYPEYISGNLTYIEHVNENKYLFTLDNDSYIFTFSTSGLNQYSFTIGNFYMFRLFYDSWDGNTHITLVVEINAIQ